MALPCRGRAVVECMPKVALTAGAADLGADLGADHAVARVPHDGDVSPVNRVKEARPPILRQSRPTERDSKEGRGSEPEHPGIVQRLCDKEQPTASVRDKLEAVDVDQAEIGDLEMRDHRQRQEGDLQERLGQRDAQGAFAAARSGSSASRTASNG